MRDVLWINKLGTYREDEKVFCGVKRIHWNMLFNQHTEFLFQDYDVAKECITRLTPADYRHKRDLKPKCLTWRCREHENCPFVLQIVPFCKKTGKTDEELKSGRYYIRKAQNHDHSQETLAELSSGNQSVSQYHKVEKKYNQAEAEMNELENRLKKTTMKDRRSKIGTKIRNLRKKIMKLKSDMGKLSNGTDQIDGESSTNSHSNKSDLEKSVKSMP